MPVLLIISLNTVHPWGFTPTSISKRSYFKDRRCIHVCISMCSFHQRLLIAGTCSGGEVFIMDIFLMRRLRYDILEDISSPSLLLVFSH